MPMPPESILDVSEIDQSKVAVTREQIYQVNPHRYEFQQLDGIFFVDSDRNIMAGFRDIRDHFWTILFYFLSLENEFPNEK